MSTIRTIKDVVDRNLCIGCGACYYALGGAGVKLVDFPNAGIRPVFTDEKAAASTEALEYCPGYRVDVREYAAKLPDEADRNPLIGATIGVWEGHASDPEIRYHGSSGGILTALALYCLERENMAFVLHTGMDETEPWRNRTVVSRTRSELLRNAGSRYTTSSPCDSLEQIERSDRPCVFIGKPCDVAAVQALRRTRPALDRNLGLVLSFFCAGTPSTHGTLELIDGFGVRRDEVTEVRYRGEGWPGSFRLRIEDRLERPSMSYMESWGRMQRYRPLRCHICPDSLGELSDITSGDAWHRYESGERSDGLSLLLARSERGREILRKAVEAGYLTVEPSSPANVIRAQGVLERRKQLFGRIAAMRLFGVPVTRLTGFHLFSSWLGIPLRLKLKTILGTMWRVVKRGYRKKRDFSSPAALRGAESRTT